MRSTYTAKLSHIASIVGGTLYGDDVQIKALTTDSRESAPEDLYIPIRGEHFDGHDFIGPLMEEEMAAGFISEKRYEKSPLPYILCSDSTRALGMIAAHYRKTFSSPLIGLTGTNGKTTTKELLACALSAKYTVHKNRKNYNNHIGVPFTLLDITTSHTAAVIEMGMNHSGEISYLTSLVKPDLAIITNADAGHLEFLGSVENVARAKSEIFESMEKGSPVFINRDTGTFEILKKNAEDRGLVCTSYGLHENADIQPDAYKLFPDSIELVYKGAQCSVPLYGVHNVSNLLAALAVAEYYNVNPEDAADALISFQNESMRGQVFEGKYTVINDAYNANPLSMKSALQSASILFPDQRKIAALGDMNELGEKSDDFHVQLGKDCAFYNIEYLLLYGDFAEHTARGAVLAGMKNTAVRVFADKQELVSDLKSLLKDGDIVLVKGSRSMKMEEVADDLVR